MKIIWGIVIILVIVFLPLIPYEKEIQMVGTSEVLKIHYGEMFSYGFSRKTQKIKKYPVYGSSDK